MAHHTKDKGDLGLVKVIADLTEKGFACYVPLSEHGAADLLAIKDRKIRSFQVKYRENLTISTSTSWSDKNGSHKSTYHVDDFDYFALYLSTNDTVYYVPWDGSFKSMKLVTEPLLTSHKYFWHEDFVDIHETMPHKRCYKDFGIDPLGSSSNPRPNTQGARPLSRKYVRPSKEELYKMISNHSYKNVAAMCGVGSTATIYRWAKEYGLT